MNELMERTVAERVEAAVIAGLLAAPGRWDDLADDLVPELFATGWLRRVFVELRRQLEDGRGVDVLALANGLEGKVSLADITGLATLSTSGAALSRHVAQLLEAHRERQLRNAASRLAELASGEGSVPDRIEAAQALIAGLDDGARGGEWLGVDDALREHLALLERRLEGQAGGISTGIDALDELLDGGLQRGSLVIIGARPSHGKTALALQLAAEIARDRCVGFLSLEMPVSDLYDRLLAALGRESVSRLKRPARGLEWDRVTAAVQRLQDRRLHVIDRAGLNIRQVRSLARGLKRRHGLDVLVVDYVGLMPGLDPRQPRTYQLGEASSGLKALAKDLGIAIIGLAQVNRGVADRADQVPMLSDLRDSGSFEQDADVVALLHRPEAAKPDLGDDFAGYALLRVAKNRQGSTGDVHLEYDGPRTTFSPWQGPVPTRRVANSGGRGL